MLCNRASYVEFSLERSGAGRKGLRIKWNKFLNNFGEIQPAKTIGLPAVAMANKQYTSLQMRLFFLAVHE